MLAFLVLRSLGTVDAPGGVNSLETNQATTSDIITLTWRDLKNVNFL